MKFVRSFLACFSTYSRIPMPPVKLDSEDMKYSMIFFPFIGAVIGVIEYYLYMFLVDKNVSRLFLACIFTVVPVIVTGGIHVDGYMDTMDALNSFGDREKKLSIMKDPNAGAFAVIYLAIYGLLFVGFADQISQKSIIQVCSIFVISRIMSAVSVVTIKSAKQNGMIHNVKKNSADRIVFTFLLLMAVVVTIPLFLTDQVFAISVVCVSVLGYFIYRHKVLKEFDGITGDTSGYYLCIMELILLIIAVVEGLL